MSKNYPEKLYAFGSDARDKLFKGIELERKCVTVTIGPNGRNVAIDRFGVVDLTKDGVTVLADVYGEDVFAEMGCKMVREASTKTNDDAGDGTTTAIEISYSVCKEGIKYLQNATNVIALTNGMTKACDVVVKELEKMAIKITKHDQYIDIATISAQDREIGKKIADVFALAKEYGVVDIERQDKVGIDTEYTKGMQIKEGWLTPYCINEPATYACVLEDCPVLITDRAITGAQELVGFQALANSGVKKCLVIADDFSGEALASFVKNNRMRTFHCCLVKAPAWGKRKGEILKDIAAMTGATVISEEGGMRLDQVELKHFGKLRQVTAKQKTTTLIVEDGHEESIKDRVDVIKKEIELSEPGFELDKLKERLAHLTDGVAVVKVGADTEIERILIKRKVDDAVHAVQCAKEEGMVPGGGTALIRCIPAVQALADSLTNLDERNGALIILKALEAPAKRILEVAGVEGGLIVETVKKMPSGSNNGYNMTDGTFTDLIDLGVVDPKKVVRVAFLNGVSCAKGFLTTEVAIAQKPEEEPKA